MAATRNDVATLAGVSPAVVSYVVNGGPRPVAPKTRERVLQAIKELNYRPNAVARALKSQQSRSIGLVLPDSSNSFFAALTRQVEDTAFEQGFVVLVGNSMNSKERECYYLDLFLEYRVDAVILMSVDDAPAIESLIESGTPVIALDRSTDRDNISSVIVDNEGGSQAATEHLLAHGHERIGTIAGPMGLAVADARVSGWRRAIEAAGKTPGPCIGMPFSREGGYQGALDLLQREDRPTAIFVASDQQAIGALRAADELDIRVPEDLALFTFDGTDDCLYSVPSLSAIRQPLEQMAVTALSVLQPGEPDSKRVHHVLPFTVELRASCGCSPHPATPSNNSEKRG